MRDIGKNIKDLRVQKQITQEELAEKLFVTRQTVSNYETGRSKPDIETLFQIAAHLDADANTLLYGPPDAAVRAKNLRTLLLSAGLTLLLVVGTSLLNGISGRLYAYRFDTRLHMTILILFKPAIFLCLGWSLMQGLGTFTKLEPMTRPKAKWGFWAALAVLLLYLVLAAPLLGSVVFRLNLTLPRFWLTLLFFMTGWGRALFRDSYLAGAFLIGIILWLCRLPGKQKR